MNICYGTLLWEGEGWEVEFVEALVGILSAYSI